MADRLGAALLAAGVALVACAGADAPAPALPPLRVRVQLEHPAATIYDPIHVRVAVDYAEGVVPDLPDAPPAIEGLTLDDAREEGPHTEAGRRRIVRTYTYHAEDAGAFIVPSLRIPYRLPDGTSAEAKTARLFVTARSVLGEGETGLDALRPIKGPVPVPRDYRPLILTLAGLLAAGAAGAYLAYRFATRPKRAASEFSVAAPADVAALNRLAALERGALLANGQVREYVYDLSEIFRDYLEGRFHVPAVASTTEQLFAELERQPALPPETRVLVKRFARDVDPIKFALAAGSVERARDWTQEIRRFVEATRPEPTLETAA